MFLGKYVFCLLFYSFFVLFCIYLVYIYKIIRFKLIRIRRDGSFFVSLSRKVKVIGFFENDLFERICF